MELVTARPTETETICSTLRPDSVQQDCLWWGAEQLMRTDADLAAKVCGELEGILAGECWFQLAEKQDQPTFCSQASPFVEDCQIHLLSRWLFRHPHTDWKEMTVRAEHYGIDPASKIGETVLYRHLVSVSQPMELSICAQTANQGACLLAGSGVYRDRLRYAEEQHTFPCTIDNQHALFHNAHPTLHPIYQEFYEANCVSP